MIKTGLGFLWERLGVALGWVIGMRVWVWFLYGKQFLKLVIINAFILSSSARLSVASFVSEPLIFYQINIIGQVISKISELLFKPTNSSRSIFYAFGLSKYNFDRFFIGIENIWGRCLFFISSEIMLSVTIYLTLLVQ
jgi:hypothetical protein